MEQAYDTSADGRMVAVDQLQREAVRAGNGLARSPMPIWNGVIAVASATA